MHYYYSLSEAAEAVGTSRTSLKRAAMKNKVGIWIRERLVAITMPQAQNLRKQINDTAGNPHKEKSK